MTTARTRLCRSCREKQAHPRAKLCPPCNAARKLLLRTHHHRFVGRTEAMAVEFEGLLTGLDKLVERTLEERRIAAATAVAREALEKKEAVQREYASRVLARRSLLHYVERKVEKYQTGWVHEDIARRLERFMRGVERKESPRLMLFVPPRHGKSELASESGPEWMVGHHPDWTFILTSYSEDLPVKYSRRVRERIQTAKYQELFRSGPHVSAIDASARAWSTEEGGEFRAAGVGGGILGMGAHVLIVDDPVKDQAVADSPTELAKINDWLTSTAFSRLAPGGGVIIIQQRWSDEDPSGRLEHQMESEMQEVIDLRAQADELMRKRDVESLREAERYREEASELDESMDRWDVVSYPALAVADEFLTPDGDIVRMTGDDPRVPKTWRKLRGTGEALHPERYSRIQLLKLKRANPRRFAAMYQQSPIVDTGEYFERGFFVRGKTPPHPADMRIVCTWDLAIGVKQRNDHTVGVAVGMDTEGSLWFLERRKGKWNDLEQIADMMIDMHRRNGAYMTGVERTHLEMALAPVMNRQQKKRGVYIAMAEGKEALKPISDKFVRARPLQALGRAGKIHVPNGDDWDDFVNWLVRFGTTTHDDDVDAAAWAAQVLSRSAPPKGRKYRPPEEVKDTRTWLEKLKDEGPEGIHVVGGGQGTFMGS